MSGDEIVIGGIGTGVVVSFLVAVAKRLGLRDGLAGLLAAGLSIALFAVYQATQLFPGIEPTVVGVLKVIAFVAVTFGGSILTYIGSKQAKIPMLGYSHKRAGGAR